jgi:hypothetical protein
LGAELQGIDSLVLIEENEFNFSGRFDYLKLRLLLIVRQI